MYLLVLVVIGSVAFGACGGNSASESSGSNGGGSAQKEPSGTVEIAGKAANDHGSKNVSALDEVEVEIDDFYFEPTVLEGDPGQKITLELGNEGSADHNFSLPDQGIDQDIASGKDAKVDVQLPDSGTVLFFCKFHTSSGMNGGLEVK